MTEKVYKLTEKQREYKRNYNRLYRQTHLEQMKEFEKKRRQKPKEREYKKNYDAMYQKKSKYKDYQKNYHKKLRDKHGEELNKKSREYHKKLRLAIISAYTNGTMKCKCGYTDIRALTIDHINGGGRQERKRIGSNSVFYNYLIKNNFPEGYQILCANCNTIKRIENNENAKKKVI